ncbi:uncharacterized protein [Argopecten irradians]|uniref:uncharacterized protein isoform X2 n=1 Tax=Argopecten irradians TaxID=31199 RepID=UPI0037139E70
MHQYKLYLPATDIYREKDMTTWSLWQKMPPRYQLTTRSPLESEETEVFIDDRPRTPRTPRPMTSPRMQGDTTPRPTPRAYIAGSPRQGEARTTNHPNMRRPLFPGRKSSYIDHIKTQKRVNSARIKMATNPSATERPKQRAKTAPINSPRGSEVCHGSRTESISQQQNRGISGSLKTESTGELSTKIDLSADVIGLEDDRSSSGTSGYSQREIPPRKFIVRETEEGTLYIDNGKVVFFRKPRKNGTDLMKVNVSGASEKGGFLASIRREYLNKPRYLANTTKKHGGRTSASEDRLIQRERLTYNQKVGHILDYYSSDDEDQISMDDLSRYTKSPKSWRNTPNTRELSPRVRKIYLDENPRRDRRHTSHQYDVMDDPSTYLKLTSQSKLHDRKFFLRTPGFQMLVPGAQGITAANFEKNCKCGMCRIEMQISLLAQLGIPFPVEEQFVDENFVRPTPSKQTDPDIQTETKTPQTEIKNEVTKPQTSTVPEVPSRPEQVLTITLPEMTSEREATDVSARESARETYRSVPGD